MINKRLLHFLSFVYFKRGQLKIHALNVAVRRQMLRHFYSMITPLLTLHTATTATLLVVKSILRNTKKRSLQSIRNTATTKLARTRSRTQAPHFVFRVQIIEENRRLGSRTVQIPPGVA